MTEYPIGAVLLPEVYSSPWRFIGAAGEATINVSDLDFRFASSAARAYRFSHPDWPISVEGHVSYDTVRSALNPVVALVEPAASDWVSWLSSFGSGAERLSARLLPSVIAKAIVDLAGDSSCSQVAVVTPFSFTEGDLARLTDMLSDTADVALWDVDGGRKVSVDLIAQPVPWSLVSLCALATERDPKTGILKDRRSGDLTPLGVSVDVDGRNSWPIFVVGVQRAEVPYLKIKGFFFHLALHENPISEHENAHQFSRSLIEISEGTVPLPDVLDMDQADNFRAEFVAKAAGFGVKVKEAKVRAMLAPEVEPMLQEAGVDVDAFRDVWSVVREQPDLLQGTYVFQSSQMPAPSVRGETASVQEEGRAGEGQGARDETPVSTNQEASENIEVASDKQQQVEPEGDPACVADAATQEPVPVEVHDEIPLDTLVGEIAAEGDAEEEIADIGEGPWDRDLDRLDDIEDGKPWMQATHIIEDAVAQADRSEKGRVSAIRDAIRALVADEQIVGYPALEGVIERLGFELVDCSKSGGPMIRHLEADLAPFLLGESAKANPLGGSSYHAGQLIEREEGNLQQAARYLDWAAAHPMWGPEANYLKSLTEAFHLVIGKNGDTAALGSDPVGLFLKLRYFGWLPKGKPDALGNWALISPDLDVIDAMQRPTAEGADAQRDAAAAIWKGDLKNGKAFLSQNGVPSQNKDIS